MTFRQHSAIQLKNKTAIIIKALNFWWDNLSLHSQAAPLPSLYTSLFARIEIDEYMKALRALLCGLAIIWSQSSPAQTPKTVFLDDLTWTELQSRIQAGTKTIIIPIGGTEQSGPYIALGKHNARVKYLSEKIALALGNALVAPVIAYVPEGTITPPTAHMKFPGTITLPNSVFQQVVESAARSFKLHGFQDIVLLGDHGGYQSDLKAVADHLNREWAHASVRAHAVPEYYDAAQSAFVRLLGKQGYRSTEIGTHAGLADTSLTLAVDPLLVRIAPLRAATSFDVNDGISGDPRRSSAELGIAGVNLIVTQTVAAIRKAVRRH